MKEKVLMLLACLWLGIGFSMAQAPKTVAGVVTSADDGEPIIGASVLVEGTTMGAITDVDGKFAINNVPADAKALIVSYLGMITQRVGIQRWTTSHGKSWTRRWRSVPPCRSRSSCRSVRRITPHSCRERRASARYSRWRSLPFPTTNASWWNSTRRTEVATSLS